MSWSLISGSESPAGAKVYARPLALNEHSFYYDRIFNGTADIIWHHLVQETGPGKAAPSLLAEDNVKRAWIALKQWYPLFGAQMDDSEGEHAVKFVASEQALSTCHPDEVVFTPVSSNAEVQTVIDRLMRIAPMEDHHLLSRVLVFPLKNEPEKCHFLFRAAHAICDGISGATIARTFFDVLASPPVPPPSLEERLAMALPYSELNPTKKLSAARQRWRRAIAQVIFLNRTSQFAGGHTVPNMANPKSYYTPTVTDAYGIHFTRAETDAIVVACRKLRITFGTAIPVISQAAVARMLHRRFLRGDIPLAEWEHRRRQPMHYAGPVNLRPYMDETWQRAGGATEVALHIDYYFATLPFMPAPFGARTDAGVPRVDGAPPLSALMSRERFLLRVRHFHRQIQRIMRSPLLLDIAVARQPVYDFKKKRNYAHWMAEKAGQPLPPMNIEPHLDRTPTDFVMTHGLSSVGQLSLILPECYPLPPNHPLSVHTPRPAAPAFATVTEASITKGPKPAPPITSRKDARLCILQSATHLHSRPMEFFLGNSTEHGRLGFNLTYDANVYRTEDVKEFIEECRLATLHYLGGDAAIKGKL